MRYKEDALPLVENEARRYPGFGEDESGQLRHGIPPPPMSSFDIESSVTSDVRERQQQQQWRVVVRPSRGLQLARPAPFEPITDPFAFVCEMMGTPKFGHQYVLCPQRSRKREARGIGLSVGPHWAGVLYTISIIGVITLFLAKVLVGPDVAPWCQPVIAGCSVVTVVFLLATAVADPGIVVESAESGESGSCGYCEECSIWTPQGAEHCEECGVCIFGLDHHCPWMGKWGNIVWFRLFNGSWILFLSLLMVAMPWVNSHKG